MEQKRRNEQKMVWGNNDVETKIEILYNDTVEQCKGMWRSLVARLFWVQNVTGSNPVIPTYYLLLLLKGAVTRNRRRSIQSGQNLSFLLYSGVRKNTLLQSYLFR